MSRNTNIHEDSVPGTVTPGAWLLRAVVALAVMGALFYSVQQRPGSVRFVAALASGLYGAVALVRFVILSLRRH